MCGILAAPLRLHRKIVVIFLWISLLHLVKNFWISLFIFVKHLMISPISVLGIYFLNKKAMMSGYLKCLEHEILRHRV